MGVVPVCDCCDIKGQSFFSSAGALPRHGQVSCSTIRDSRTVTSRVGENNLPADYL